MKSYLILLFFFIFFYYLVPHINLVHAVPTAIPTFDASTVFGTPIKAPMDNAPTDPKAALIKMLNVGLNLVLIGGALITLFNFITAAYMYITSSGDSKRVAVANSRMTYTVIGLIILVLVPMIAAVLGIIIFQRWDAILNPDFKSFGGP